MAFFRTVTFIGVILISFSGPSARFARSDDTPPIKVITVVMDDNYPPYIFRDSDGELRGILFDEWNLWQKKTGVRVVISAMSWNRALKEMEEGKFDVIDTIFRNPKRDQILDFTPPYARIDVPIFFHKDISGISGLKDISGFVIGVKDGDNVIDALSEKSGAKIQTFDSYESIVRAAADGSIKVFSIDRPPAIFFLNKYNIISDFKETEPLYYGEIHRAVKKGNSIMLKMVNDGFAKISAAESDQIERKWFGSPIFAPLSKKEILTAAGTTAGVILLLFLWVYFLKRTVRAQTRELRDAKDQITAIYDSVSDGIMVHNADGSISDMNRRFGEMYGYTKEEMLSMNIAQLSLAEEGYSQDKALEMMRYAKTGGPQTFEWMAKPRSNAAFPVEISLLHTKIGGREKFLASVRDITERKSGDAQLKRTLEEREALLRELYHRTKNNMQVICSLLHLESTRLPDPDTRQIFLEMENRIYSMALVHQKLYGSKNLSRISLKEYIEELSDLLLKSYDNFQGRISVNLETEDISVVLDAAIPCGLVINELVSNAFKHAFPGERKGVITIKLRRTGEDGIELIVSDNGVGFPPGFDPENSGRLGLKIIMNIGRQQLDGTIDYISENGITCRLVFSDGIFKPRV